MNSDQNPLDPSNFRQMIIESPGQFAKGFALAKDIQLDGNFKQVVISGMGGSALWLGEPLPAWKLVAATLVMGGLAVNLMWPRLRSGSRAKN